MGTSFNWRDALQAGAQALAGASGNQQLLNQIQQQRDQKQQAADQLKQASLQKVGLAQKKVAAMLASGTHPETGAPLSDIERQNLTQTSQTLNDYANQISTGQGPSKRPTRQPAAAPGGAPQAPQQPPQDPMAAVQQYSADIPANPYAQKYNQIMQAFNGHVAPEEAMQFALGNAPKSLQDKVIAQLEAKGVKPEQIWDRLHPQKEEKIQAAEPLEKGGVIYGVKDPATGREYLASEMSSPSTPQNVKEIYKTITAAQDQKEGDKRTHEQRMATQFQQSQERIEREHDRSAAATGTWTITEGDDGKPQLFNSKTGETKDAPAGMHKSGYYAKQVAPLAASAENIKEYMGGGVFTGPGDLDLQHQYFAATQPPSGFRMTKVQQDILAGSQSWINGIKGKFRHAATGTWFSDEQRRQIADEAQKAIVAKQKALSGEKQDVFIPDGSGSEVAKKLGAAKTAPSDDDIIKALSGAK